MCLVELYKVSKQTTSFDQLRYRNKYLLDIKSDNTLQKKPEIHVDLENVPAQLGISNSTDDIKFITFNSFISWILHEIYNYLSTFIWASSISQGLRVMVTGL